MEKKKRSSADRKTIKSAPSTITRIVGIIIVLVLPVNIMTLVLSHMVIQKSTEQSYREVQNNLDLCAANLMESISHASRRLINLSYNDTDFVKLENAADTTGISTSLYNVRDAVKTTCQEYDVVDIVFFHFPNLNYTITNGYSSMGVQSYRDLIEENAELDRGYGMTWEFCSVDDISVLFGCARWNGADFGVFLELERTLGKLNLSDIFEDNVVFFMNSDGSMCTETGELYFDQEKITLEEMEKSGKYHVFQAKLEDYDLVLVEVVKGRGFTQKMTFPLLLLQIVSIILTVLVIPLLLLYIHRWVSLPLNRLIYGISRIERGDMDYRISYNEEGREFEQINRNFNDMMDRVSDLKIDIYEKELERKNIKMRYLSQQIQPHFILNAMNILYSYEPEEFPLIQRMILCISKYFRYIVKANSRFVYLQQEMEHIRNYFEIQKARYPEMFFSVVEYNEELRDALLPPLLIQNFAENAIKYALKIGQKAEITVTADYLGGDRRSNKILVCVADTGEGITEEKIEKIEKFKKNGIPQEGLGIGIQNSIERLKYLYSDLSSVCFSRRKDRSGTIVEIILPVYFAGGEGEEENESIID